MELSNTSNQKRFVLFHLTNNLLVISAIATGLLLPDIAVAQVVENNILQNTLNTYETRMATIVASIGGLLINTFYLLALIEFTWGMIKNYIDNGGLQGFLSEIVTRIMFIGFFLYLFQNGTAIPSQIIDSFQVLAASVPGTTAVLRPDNIVDIGQNFLSQSWTVITSGNVLSGLGMLFASVIVFIAMVILAAHLAVAILEMFVVGYAGFVLLALGGSRWTHGYAVAYLKYAMSVGMKLFVLYIIAAVVAAEMAAYFTAVAESSLTNVWAVAAFALFSVIIAIIAPQSVMGMMSGVSVASGAGAVAAGAAITSSAAAGSSAVRTGASTLTSAAGVASATSAAAKLGTAAARVNTGGAAASAVSGASAVAKGVGGSAGSVAASALSKAFPVGESVGGQMAKRMNQATNNIES